MGLARRRGEHITFSPLLLKSLFSLSKSNRARSETFAGDIRSAVLFSFLYFGIVRKLRQLQRNDMDLIDRAQCIANAISKSYISRSHSTEFVSAFGPLLRFGLLSSFSLRSVLLVDDGDSRKCIHANSVN